MGLGNRLLNNEGGKLDSIKVRSFITIIFPEFQPFHSVYFKMDPINSTSVNVLHVFIATKQS